MTRAPCCDKSGTKKGPWTPEEDQKLVEYIRQNGHGSLLRCGKSCRLRWTNYLRPDIKRGNFSIEEETAIITLHSILGNKWSAIAARLPGRTDNEIKNHWNTHLKKRLLKMGIDPLTHESISSPDPPNMDQGLSFSAIMSQAGTPTNHFVSQSVRPMNMSGGFCLQEPIHDGDQVNYSGLSKFMEGHGCYLGTMASSMSKELESEAAMGQVWPTDGERIGHGCIEGKGQYWSGLLKCVAAVMKPGGFMKT
ncbi:hypothetical protein AMTRI_Chr10g231170 [Amborella trichopoda]